MRTQAVALGLVAAVALGASVGALAGRSSSAKTTIQVTEREYRISLSANKAPSGPVVLVVHNAGRIPHALSVSGPGLAPVSTPAIQPGATKTVRVTLGGGAFTVRCPVGSHAASGMKTTLTVRGAAAPPAGTSTSVGGGYDDGGYGNYTP